MITGKNVRVELLKQDKFVGASGSIQIAEEERGKLILNVDGDPSIAVSLQDTLEVIQRAITERG